ncbi:MAG: TetR/AcrR family transcriptional regulator [Rhizobiaceae bacterium]
MAGKRELKREELKGSLLAAASNIIEGDGIRALNARTVTSNAGCALGSLYTAFEDLDDLIIHVNSLTLRRLAEDLANDMKDVKEPVAVLKGLATGYVRFARNNFALWSTLFDYYAITIGDVPDWHQEEQTFLINYIQEPVMQLSPGLSLEEATLRSRTLFAAVHGIVTFSLQDRYIGVAPDELESELDKFIDQMLKGLSSTSV